MTRRRVGNGSGWTPGTPSGLLLWLKSDTQTFQDSAFTTAAALDGDVVGGWKDQSGNGNHVTQATTANKPLLKLAQVNGKPSVRCDGVNDMLQSLFTLDIPFDLFVVMKQIGWVEGGSLVTGGANDNFSLYQHAASAAFDIYNGVTTGAHNTNLAAATWGLVEAGMPSGGGNDYTLVNAGTAVIGGVPSSLVRGGITLGAHPGPSNWGNVEFSEVLLYSRILGTTEAANLRSYVHTTYAVF